MADSRQEARSREAFEQLDRVIHEKARLEILTTLIGKPEGTSFNELRELCQLTDGNLNRHLKVLLDSEIVERQKSGRGRNTKSQFFLSPAGKRAFERYLAALESIIRQASLAEGSNHTASRDVAADRNQNEGDGQLSVSPG